MKQYSVSFLLQSDLECDDKEAVAQIANALWHHLHDDGFKVAGPITVERAINLQVVPSRSPRRES